MVSKSGQMKTYSMKCLLLMTLGFTLFWGSVASADAENLKVGYIDTAKVLKQAPQADVARKKLEDEFNPRDQEIVKLQKELKNLNEKQERDAQLMSRADSIKLERKVVSVKRDIKRAKEEFNEDFNLRRNEELAKLHKLISKTTIQIAQEQNYDVILSDNVLFISKRVDITETVLKRLRDLQKGPGRETGQTN